MKVLDKFFEDKTFISGERLSAVDLAFAYSIKYNQKLVRATNKSGCRNFIRYYNTIINQPEFEGITLDLFRKAELPSQSTLSETSSIPQGQNIDMTICSADSSYVLSSSIVPKYEGKIKAYVDFTKFNKNYSAYKKDHKIIYSSDDDSDEYSVSEEQTPFDEASPLDKFFQDKIFINGEQLTVADLAFVSCFKYLYVRALNSDSNCIYPHFHQYYNTVVNQPEFRKVSSLELFEI